jgi:DtxR family Mn-dependent transcriptional regulator
MTGDMKRDAVKRLSASLEDYLEAIFWAVAATGRARPRDIAKRLHVKASSVTGALQVLAAKDYVQYEPYEAVTLTRAGFDAGARVARRHHILRVHLTELLGIDEETADQGACRLEHGIPPVVVDRLVQFHSFLKNLPSECRQHVMSFSENGRDGRLPEDVGVGDTTVADLKVGQQGVIAAVKANGSISQRLTGMGLGWGALIKVEEIGPKGTPIQVAIRGQRSVLCKHEAESIVVIGR